MVGVSPSSSVAVAKHVSSVDVVTPELGLIETAVTSGLVLSTVTEAVSASVSPPESSAVAVQVMVSSGELLEVLSAKSAPAPRLLPVRVLVQA